MKRIALIFLSILSLLPIAAQEELTPLVDELTRRYPHHIQRSVDVQIFPDGFLREETYGVVLPLGILSKSLADSILTHMEHSSLTTAGESIRYHTHQPTDSISYLLTYRRQPRASLREMGMEREVLGSKELGDAEMSGFALLTRGSRNLSLVIKSNSVPAVVERTFIDFSPIDSLLNGLRLRAGAKTDSVVYRHMPGDTSCHKREWLLHYHYNDFDQKATTGILLRLPVTPDLNDIYSSIVNLLESYTQITDRRYTFFRTPNEILLTNLGRETLVARMKSDGELWLLRVSTPSGEAAIPNDWAGEKPALSGTQVIF